MAFGIAGAPDIGSTPNGVSYPELGFTNTHYSQTHHANEAEKVRKVAAITEFNIAQTGFFEGGVD